MATTSPQILGAVIESGRLYKAGDEAALAQVMRGKSVQHLLDNGTLSGDWGAAPEATADAREAHGSAAGAPSTPPVATHSARKRRAKKEG